MFPSPIITSPSPSIHIIELESDEIIATEPLENVRHFISELLEDQEMTKDASFEVLQELANGLSFHLELNE